MHQDRRRMRRNSGMKWLEEAQANVQDGSCELPNLRWDRYPNTLCKALTTIRPRAWKKLAFAPGSAKQANMIVDHLTVFPCLEIIEITLPQECLEHLALKSLFRKLTRTSSFENLKIIGVSNADWIKSDSFGIFCELIRTTRSLQVVRIISPKHSAGAPFHLKKALLNRDIPLKSFSYVFHEVPGSSITMSQQDIFIFAGVINLKAVRESISLVLPKSEIEKGLQLFHSSAEKVPRLEGPHGKRAKPLACFLVREGSTRNAKVEDSFRGRKYVGVSMELW